MSGGRVTGGYATGSLAEQGTLEEGKGPGAHLANLESQNWA